MKKQELIWLEERFPSQLIEIISITDISPETYKSTLQETTEAFVRVVGKSFASDFCAALGYAIQREERNES